MQQTSALYRQLVALPDHHFETKLEIDEHPVTDGYIYSVKRSRPGIDSKYPTIGGVMSASMDVEIAEPLFTIPTMAEINVYVRAIGIVNDEKEESEWIPQGTYYVDTRTLTDSGTIELTAYDAILKTEKVYPDTVHAWPYPDIDVLEEIADDIGIELDEKTEEIVTAGLMIDLPANYTEREVLGMIASAYAGNFVISDSNTLLFVPLYGFGDDNVTGNYLADDDGTTALTFGSEGWYILV